MTTKIENGQLVITVPLSTAPQLSSTGKSLMLYSTQGFNKPSGLIVNGKQVAISMNVIIPSR